MANYDLTLLGERKEVSAERRGESLVARVGDKEFVFEPTGDGLYAVAHDGHRHIAAAVKHKDAYYVDIDSVLYELKDAADDMAAGSAGDMHGEKNKIYAPMPGKIVKIMVAVGDEVDVKQPMVIVEAMKMENQVNARAKGRVKAVNFSAGDQVNTEQAIIELEVPEG